ncbi:MAG: ABC transporter permease subunit, partial [Anaerolineales bacterium]|nr:ABC transporter permease subunit [Anaerolineales bacterium]
MSSLSRYESMRTSQKFQKRLSVGIRLVVAVILIVFATFPVLWIISASFDSSQSLSTQTLIPSRISLTNYARLFGLDPTYKFGDLFYQKWVFNSIKVSGISTILSLFITTMAAYAFSRMRFAGRVTMLKGILLIQVFPNLLALVAIYVFIFQTGQIVPAFGLNSHAGLIMVYLGGSMGINIWLMKGFLDTIPRAIDESGMVDGASHFQIFWNLLLPLLRPILVVIGILSFIGTYGDFILARI